MKTLTFNPITLSLMLGSMAFATGNAQASASFDSTATLTYTITSIANDTHPGDFGNLIINASFEQDTSASNSYQIINGVGTIDAANPAYSSLLTPQVGASFSRTFNVSGNLTGGTLESHHLGLFGLNFENLGTDTYSIGVSLSYALSPSVAGPEADSDITLDWFNEDGSAFGYYYVYANQPSQGNAGPAVYNFTLGALAADALYADVAINGNLAAAPVPLPAATWSFLAGLLGILGLRKRKIGDMTVS